MMRWMRGLPIFSILFPILYEPTMYFNWPVFTYLPQVKEFHALRYAPAAAQGPGMYYYGWLLTAGLTAGVIALVLSYAPEKMTARIPANLAWIAPLVVLVMLLDILSFWFTRT
jgi:hypothetical protein